MFIPSENKVHYYYYKERETSKKAVNQGAVILQIIFGIYTRCQQMKVKVRSSKFERQKMYIHFETEPGREFDTRIKHYNYHSSIFKGWLYGDIHSVLLNEISASSTDKFNPLGNSTFDYNAVFFIWRFYRYSQTTRLA